MLCPASMGGALNRSRRTLVVGGACAFALTVSQLGRSARSAARAGFTTMEAEMAGRIGVSAVDTGSGARLSHRGGERFAMCSTFKWMLAAAVLARHDQAGGILGHHLSFGTRD